MWSKEVDELKARFIVLKSAEICKKLIVVLGKVCLRQVSPFAILSFSCPCSDLQRSGSPPFSKNNVQTCSRSCNWNSTKIDKILFLLFLDIKLHMYDITVIYIQKKMNLFWGLQVGLCSTPIAYKAGQVYIIYCLLLFIVRYFNFNEERATLQSNC